MYFTPPVLLKRGIRGGILVKRDFDLLRELLIEVEREDKVDLSSYD